MVIGGDPAPPPYRIKIALLSTIHNSPLEVPTPPAQCQSVQTHAGSWWDHHDALGRRWAVVERSQRAEAEAASRLLATRTEDTVRPLIKRGEHEETPGFQNFAVFCPLCIVRGTGVCHKHSEVGHLVVARGTGWG